MKKSFIFLFIIAALVPPIQAYAVIYEDPSALKAIKLTSDICVLGISCTNEIYVNGTRLGDFLDGESIEIRDGSNITIVLDEPLNTNLENVGDKSKSALTIAFMVFIQPLIIIIVVFLLIKWAMSRPRGRR